MNRIISRLFFLLVIINLLSYIPRCVCQSQQAGHDSIDLKRKLIITADDFGASPKINEGIIQGIDSGFVNTVSAMVNFPGTTKELIQLHRKFPEVGIGLHLNITAGPPILKPEEIPTLIDSDSNFYDLISLLGVIDKVSLIELEKELDEQIKALIKTGIPVDHLSSQNHILHIYSPFFDVVIKLAKEYEVPVRFNIPSSVNNKTFKDSPVREFGLKIAMNFITSDPYKAAKFIKYKTLDEMNQNSQKLINDSILHPDHLIDAFWGIPTIERLEFILSNLPEGTSELALHLGLDHDTIQVPKGIDKKYLPFRQKELNVIKTNEARELLNKLNIEIVQFSDLYWIQNQKIETKSDY